MTLARFVDDVWQGLGRPDPFVVGEHGAGEGALAIAILTGLRASRSDLAEVIRYRPIEVDPRRVAAFEYHVSDAGFGSAIETADRMPYTGLVLADEVADALPVHRIVQRGASCSRSESDSTASDSSMSRRHRPRPTCSSGSPRKA